MSKELKPCPFCGGKASLNYERIPGEDKGFWAQVICNVCHGRSGGTWAGSYNTAERIEVKAWNRRANDVINNMSTAYDVDKVVRQLEAYSNADEAERLGTMPVVELADAIKIVEGGGVDAKTDS
jgi:hypothetical protein|nr:MAG TPA: restriction alleviation protein [Bacteriophage sp.]